MPMAMHMEEPKKQRFNHFYEKRQKNKELTITQKIKTYPS
jgi:hypothetical protein